VPEDWAGSLDLHVDLPSGGGRRAALERAVREAIRDGRLRPGDRIPSTRALAHDLGLARGTVAEAYAQLGAEGYLVARPGAPTRVAVGVRADVRGESAVGGGAAPAATEGAAAGGDRRTAASEPQLSLQPGLPDVSAFPRSAWVGALRRGLASAPDAVLRPGDPRGQLELRTALARYLGRARGVLADPERIVVCSGFTEGLALLCRTLRGTGALAMEDPCLPDHRAIAHAAGMRVAPLAVDEAGARPDVPPDVAAALLTPAHQFPLGATLAPERRSAFVAWAREHGALVIEDDYDGEFRYDRQPAGALQGLDPEHVVYAGTASKTLAPALRLGWLVLPQRLLEPVLDAKRLAGDTPALEQLALAELLAGGAYDRHVRRMRQRYRRRRDALLARLGERRALGIAAGLHVVVEVESEQAVLANAAPVELEPLALYWHRERGFEGLVVGYAAPPDHAFAAALGALVDALDGSNVNGGR
jgi:GntR family transcriptional regulator/MocR family aminotransferase